VDARGPRVTPEIAGALEAFRAAEEVCVCALTDSADAESLAVLVRDLDKAYARLRALISDPLRSHATDG